MKKISKLRKGFDLEERTFNFAKNIRDYCDKLPKTITNIEIAKQLMRAGGSIGANYIEANEALSKKDFIMRIKICRKEAKESRYWLRLSLSKESEKRIQETLIDEATQFIKIFNSIIQKSV